MERAREPIYIMQVHGFFHVTNLDFYQSPPVQKWLKVLIGDVSFSRRNDDPIAVTVPAAVWTPTQAWDMYTRMVFVPKSITMAFWMATDNSVCQKDSISIIGPRMVQVTFRKPLESAILQTGGKALFLDLNRQQKLSYRPTNRLQLGHRRYFRR